MSAKRLDLAIEVLGLNMHVYPQHIESYIDQAKLYLQKGEFASAEQCLLKALSVEPNNTRALELLEQVSQH